MKKCRSCGIEKVDHLFYRRSSNLDCLYSYCKECTLVKGRNISDEKRKERNEKAREYKKKNVEFLRKQSLDYYYRNRDRCLKKAKDYRANHKKNISRLSDEDRFEKNRTRYLNWSKNNRERLNEYQRSWYYKNKEKKRAYVQLNRAVASGKIERPGSCSECKKKCKPDGHHMDYSKPLSVVWICRACHSRKSPRAVIK